MEADLWGHEIELDERAARFCVWASRALNAAGFEELLIGTEGHIRQIWDTGRLESLELSEDLRQRLQNVVCTDYQALWNEQMRQLSDEITLLHRGDADYPERFCCLTDPPIFLYVWGKVSCLHTGRKVAIVGSRAADLAMHALTETLAAGLAKQHIAVISGGALGVDGCAHRGSLLAGGTTLAFLPGAINRPAPARHRDLFAEIAQTGAVLSEYPPGVSARPFHFARRNRLIAALSDAVIVIRAEPDSGTMITARAAEELGRPICAVPGALDDPFAEGCLQLLVEGALAVRNADDVVFQVYESELEHAPTKRAPGRARRARARGSKSADTQNTQVNLPLDLSGLASDRQQVLRAIDELGRTTNCREVLVDDLARHLQWSVVQVNNLLVELELYQRIMKVPGTNAYCLLGRLPGG